MESKARCVFFFSRGWAVWVFVAKAPKSEMKSLALEALGREGLIFFKLREKERNIVCMHSFWNGW